MRSPHKSDKAVESQHVPASAAVATRGPIPTPAFGERVVGAAAIALVASLVIQNAVLVWAGAPGFGDPIEKVLAFHAEHRGAVAIAVGSEALNLPLLLVFVTGLHGLVGRRGGAGADWSRLAVAAGATLAALFALYAVLWNGVVLSAGESRAEPAVQARLAAACRSIRSGAVGARHHLHRRCAGGACESAGGAVAACARRGRGVLLIAAGVANLAIADGSPILFVGLLGYAAWLVWLLVTGVRLVRPRGGPAA